MRQRNRRRLGIVIGIVLVCVAIPVAGRLAMTVPALVNLFRSPPRVPPREGAEKALIERGESVLRYGCIVETTGHRRTGAKFTDELKAWDGKEVQVVGYMVPLDQFDEMERFVLLPLPVHCLKCRPPPQRDMVLVELLEPARIVNEPVLVSGTLSLTDDAGQPFWYRITSARWRAPREGEGLTGRVVQEGHRHVPAELMEGLESGAG